MGSFLNGLGTLVGGQGNAGAASSNAWNYGQYSPFTVNNPAGQVSFNGNQANSSMSPLQTQLQGAFGGAINGGLGQGYNPNTGFLPQQYQQIFGGMNDNANGMFQSLMNAQAPWMAQGNMSNLDNQFSKGTLASTAGGYQTAGHDMANSAIIGQNQAQAQQYALGRAQSQFGAAQQTAGLGEQQAQFAPQLGLQQAQAGIGGLQNQNQNFLQMLQAGGNLGAQRSGANVAAATPGIETGQIQDQASSGLLSGLLFGGGSTGGLLNGLLGGSGSGMNGLAQLLGKGGNALGSLFGGNSSSGGGGGYTNPGTGGVPWAGDTQGTFDSGAGTPTTTDSGGGITTQFDDGGGNWFGGTGFNGAGGQAANQVSELPSVENAINQGSGSQGLGGAGLLSGLGGIASGLAKGGVAGDLQAGAGVAGMYNKVTGNAGGFSGLLGQAGSALNIYNGLTSGTPQGVVSGLASGAGLAASSGAASALGASAGTVGALGAAATGIGAVAAIPAVVSGVGGLLFNNLLGVDKPDKMGNELSILRNKGGVNTVSGTAGQNTFGLGTQQKDYYEGKDISGKMADPQVVQRASDLYQSGNMAAYKQYMESLINA